MYVQGTTDTDDRNTAKNANISCSSTNSYCTGGGKNLLSEKGTASSRPINRMEDYVKEDHLKNR